MNGRTKWKGGETGRKEWQRHSTEGLGPWGFKLNKGAADTITTIELLVIDPLIDVKEAFTS